MVTLEDLIFQADQALAPEDERDPTDEVLIDGETWRGMVSAAAARERVITNAAGERVAEPLAVPLEEHRRVQLLLHNEFCAHAFDAPPERHHWKCSLHTYGGRGNACPEDEL